jgi:hypothetical protein
MGRSSGSTFREDYVWDLLGRRRAEN